MAKHVFGIDLGTTYSCIAHVDENEKPVVIPNLEGTYTTPSVVNFPDAGQFVVGQIAKESAVVDPQNTVAFVKRYMGKSDFVKSCHGEDKSPEEVSSYILRKLAEDASRALDTEVKSVVITCPAYFGDQEKVATKNAGKIAGLDVLAIIAEPVAAAIYYGMTRSDAEKTILIYDLGGGTFDVTVMRISSEKIEVICTDGDAELGGKDWDEELIRYLWNEFKSKKNHDGEMDDETREDLRLKAENAKQHLTGKEKTTVPVDVAGLKERIEITREAFEELTLPLLNKSIEITDRAIEVAKGKGCSVDEILLVGGSTKMPQVSKALTEKYGKEPKKLDPDEAVAKGAAIHAIEVYIQNKIDLTKWQEAQENPQAGGSGENVAAPSQDVIENKESYAEELAVVPQNMTLGGKRREIVGAAPKSYAVEVIMNEKDVCYNMILKNDAMEGGSITKTATFGTHRDFQEIVPIKIYESDFLEETYEIDEDYLLGEATLELTEKYPAGAPIDVTLSLNSEGILNVTGKDATSGKEVKATMQSKFVMSEEKVKEIAEKSQKLVLQK
jgi:molecular chaperone DnaK (HSP70)